MKQVLVAVLRSQFCGNPAKFDDGRYHAVVKRAFKSIVAK